MKKIIPFRKEITFDTNLYEVNSISLENTLHKEDNIVVGDFIVSGDYLVTESSIDTVPFNYHLPFTIDIDETYDISNANIDINDFFYEIVNNKILVVNIEVKIDNIKEVIFERNDNMNILNIDDYKEESNDVDTNIEDNDINITKIDLGDINIKTDEVKDLKDIKDIKKSLFQGLNQEDNYVNYRIYIIRENDNLDNIISKYNITKDILEEYNDCSSLKIGDKIIIPYVKG